MKKIKKKRMLHGLKNIQSKYYREFSEKEHSIISSVIDFLKKKKLKNKWLKEIGKILNPIVTVIKNMF